MWNGSLRFLKFVVVKAAKAVRMVKVVAVAETVDSKYVGIAEAARVGIVVAAVKSARIADDVTGVDVAELEVVWEVNSASAHS